LPEELVMQNWIYKRGEEKGREEARGESLELLVRVCESRLGRPVSAAERGVLVRRLGTLGLQRLGDLVLDLPADALAAWLSAPDAS
jgi:hypothetical protein